MFDKFIKWLSIGFALLVFAVMLFAAIQNMLANPAITGIIVVLVIVSFLIVNGIYELIMMVLNYDNGEITHGSDMTIKNDKLETQSEIKD